MKNKMGKVILVGAGAGDTGLLTIKGKKYIEEADCIIYDRLASPELLGMAKHDCECIYVGKENHKHIMKQDAINELLYKKIQRIQSGRTAKRVVIPTSLEEAVKKHYIFGKERLI